MPAPRTISLGIALTITSVLIFVASVLFMSWRVAEHHRSAPPPEYLFKSITRRSFEVWGRPLNLTDVTVDGEHALHIRYGDRELDLPVHHPKVSGMPELDAYEEWLALTAFSPLDKGEVPLDLSGAQARDFRLVIVKRNPAPGHDDEMGGLVGRKLWTFDLVEFLPSGDITQRRVQFPAVEYGTGKKYLPALRADPSAKVEPIAERSWEFQAALLAIPRLYISTYRYRDTSVQAMGWTLPAAGFSMMGVVCGVAVWQGGRLGAARLARARLAQA